MTKPKQYDKAYFDKWYRNARTRVSSELEVRRKVVLAVSLAEYYLRRTIRSVLDIGCGEAPWREHLRELRPRVSYLGLDPSEYVVERFGKLRNIRQATFGELASLKLEPRDLVICSDVLHYVPNEEIRTGAPEIARLARGMAYLEVLTKEDDIVGDLNGLLRRPARFYRGVFTKADLLQVGPYSWLPPTVSMFAAELEKP